MFKKIACLSLLTLSFTTIADTIGVTVKVLDGDTIDVLTEKYCNVHSFEKKGGSKCVNGQEQIRVRFASIDAPEKKQPFGDKSKTFLESLVFKKKVRIVNRKTDIHGRVLADVYVGDEWINKVLISNGMAWVYRQYAKNSPLLKYEENAKSNKIGLWSLPSQERIEPWVWRKNAKN